MKLPHLNAKMRNLTSNSRLINMKISIFNLKLKQWKYPFLIPEHDAALFTFWACPSFWAEFGQLLSSGKRRPFPPTWFNQSRPQKQGSSNKSITKTSQLQKSWPKLGPLKMAHLLIFYAGTNTCTSWSWAKLPKLKSDSTVNILFLKKV